MSRQSSKVIIDAVCRVLQQANEPLPFRDIAQRLTAQHLWTPPAERAEEWLDAIICEHIREQKADARLRRDERGVFELSLLEMPVVDARPSARPNASRSTIATGPLQTQLVIIAAGVLSRVGVNRVLGVHEIVERAQAARLIPRHTFDARHAMTVALESWLRRPRDRNRCFHLSRQGTNRYQIHAPVDMDGLRDMLASQPHPAVQSTARWKPQRTTNAGKQRQSKPVAHRQSVAAAAGARTQSRRRRSEQTTDYAALAEEILREVGQPLTYQEIAIHAHVAGRINGSLDAALDGMALAIYLQSDRKLPRNPRFRVLPNGLVSVSSQSTAASRRRR